METRERSVLRFLSVHNPFYLLSALMMLAACFLIINPWGHGGRKVADLFLSWGVLGGYEIAVIVMAILLFRLGKARRDVGNLAFVAMLFLFDCVFLADAMAISGGQYAMYFVLAVLAAAGAKLAALMVGLRIRVEIDSLIFVGLCLAIMFAAPVVISQCIHAGANCEVALFYLWAAFTAVVFGFSLWRYLSGRTWKKGSVPGFWRLPVTMGLVMGVVHLVAVGLELAGGFAFDYVITLACISPLFVRWLVPSLLNKNEVRAMVDAIPGALLVLVAVIPGKCGSALLAEPLSCHLAVVLGFAVTGFLYLKERHLANLGWGTAIVALSLLDSAVVVNWGGDDLLLLFSWGVAVCYGSSLMFLRRGDRYSLAFLVGGANLLLAALLASFGSASFFVYAQHTGLALLVLEFLLWRDSNPLFRNVVAGCLIAVSCAYMLGYGGTYLHVYAASQAGSFLALAMWLRLGWLVHISGAGSAVVLVKAFTFAWPETMRGWGILLAACAGAMLALGFWLSLRHKALESVRNDRGLSP